MNRYQQLPAPPDSVSIGTILARLIDTIGFRFHMATEGFTENEVAFRPVEGSMNVMELMKHMYQVLFFAYSCFDQEARYDRSLASFADFRQAILETCTTFQARLQHMSDEEIAAVTVYLKRNDTAYPVWYLINGPIGDVLTHVGQLVSWRRIAGNPIARISPFTGEPF